MCERPDPGLDEGEAFRVSADSETYNFTNGVDGAHLAAMERRRAAAAAMTREFRPEDEYVD